MAGQENLTAIRGISVFEYPACAARLSNHREDRPAEPEPYRAVDPARAGL